MANFKHKVFLLIAKWIPVAVAAGILINNTLAMLDVKDVILDLFDITVGSSLAFVIMMYASCKSRNLNRLRDFSYPYVIGDISCKFVV